VATGAALCHGSAKWPTGAWSGRCWAGHFAARRSTRSAGAAGTAAVVVTSAVTWAIQQAVQRDRPPTLTALVTRGSVRRPAASSFPSTHAANAFAFAAAAGTICPGLSVVLVPLAAAIGVARVGIAHHYPADVVAGALTGAGIGTAIGLFLRRRYPRSSPPEPAEPASKNWAIGGRSARARPAATGGL